MIGDMRQVNAAMVLATLASAALAAEAPVRVVPAPRKVHFERGRFVIDERTAVLVSAQATRGTRVAARAVQLGLRERFGLDLPIRRITDIPKRQPFKAIWVIEPRILRPPANTIGVEGLHFTREMVYEGYFIRVDPIEVVLHGASDAGSFYAAWTFLQLVEPPRRATLFSKGRGPSVPCLWLEDWPQRRWRALPAEIKVPPDPGEAARLLRLAARYRFNVLARESLPPGLARAGAVEQALAFYPIRFLDQAIKAPGPKDQPPPASAPHIEGRHPLARLARRAIAARDWELALAALGEMAWGPPDPSPEDLVRTIRRLSPAGSKR